MSSPISKLDLLSAILQQEQQKDFRDSIVIGGLDRFIQRWANDLSPILGNLTSYSILTPVQRKNWASTVLKKISDSQGVTTITKVPGEQRSTRRSRNRKPTILSIDDPLTRLSRVRVETVKKLGRLGMEKIGDLVYLFPNRHNDFANILKITALQPGTEQTIVATVWEATQTGTGPRRKSTQAVLGDDSGTVRAIWFNQPWMAKTLRSGTQMVISGRVTVFRGQLVFESPEYELLEGQRELLHTGRLVPVYPSTEKLPQRTLRKIVKQALDACLENINDFLPTVIRDRVGVPKLQDSIAQMHYPDSLSAWQIARRRLAFDELFFRQLEIVQRKREWQEIGRGTAIKIDRTVVENFLKSLPFTLTKSQKTSLADILDDLSRDVPMSRLLQGDVGSGKTVVAVAALLATIASGYQAALMAPTEILAEQHFMSITTLLCGETRVSKFKHLVEIAIPGHSKPVVIGLLLGSLTKQSKTDLYERLANGNIDIVIGTHAVIQPQVNIEQLALVVVDEQHRFGVMQRGSLREKGEWPHLLAMSATPIPRSLALTMYGDLDISTIDEPPAGRQQIRTRWVESKRRDATYEFIRKEVGQGRQAFIVCPFIEESETIQSRAAIKEHQRLSKDIFPELKLGLLHGRMGLLDKEKVMTLFKTGELDILVSTPVIEVGIDVPNASVMLIDGADRFGLAQLHQFRGRVGRGIHQSFCLLLSDAPSQDARGRLKILERVRDGFALAEEDLRLRGPGDYMGTRQSGLPDLQVAKITDQDILQIARREAIYILDTDPKLSKPENKFLNIKYGNYIDNLSREIS